MNTEKKTPIIIAGPTGVGKTDLSTLLAERVAGEIVNIDVGQFYAPLSIGTAKPHWQAEPIAHHLFDICDKPQDITVVEYRQRVHACIEDIWSRGKRPILVGGSGFYIQSLFFPPLADHISIVSRSLVIPSREEKEALWLQLHTIDPERAAAIDPSDWYRTQRALDIWQATGKKPSLYVPVYNPIAPCDIYIVNREKADLNERIRSRTLQMLNGGWPQEVDALRGTAWELFLKQKKLIGYDTLFEHPVINEQVVDTIVRNTCAYAKRQCTFYRRLDRMMPGNITWLNLTLVAQELYISQLVARYEGHSKN